MDKRAINNYQTLHRFCRTLGLNFFGVADVAGVKAGFALSKDTKDKTQRAIVIGTRLSAAVLEEILQEPTRLY